MSDTERPVQRETLEHAALPRRVLRVPMVSIVLLPLVEQLSMKRTNFGLGPRYPRPSYSADGTSTQPERSVNRTEQKGRYPHDDEARLVVESNPVCLSPKSPYRHLVTQTEHDHVAPKACESHRRNCSNQYTAARMSRSRFSSGEGAKPHLCVAVDPLTHRVVIIEKGSDLEICFDGFPTTVPYPMVSRPPKCHPTCHDSGCKCRHRRPVAKTHTRDHRMPFFKRNGIDALSSTPAPLAAAT